MEKERIERTVPKIPISELGRVARDGEIWEQQDGGAYFMVTRHHLDGLPTYVEATSLNVSGPPGERARVIDEFAEVLGPPAQVDNNPYDLHRVDFATWLHDTRVRQPLP